MITYIILLIYACIMMAIITKLGFEHTILRNTAVTEKDEEKADRAYSKLTYAIFLALLGGVCLYAYTNHLVRTGVDIMFSLMVVGAISLPIIVSKITLYFLNRKHNQKIDIFLGNKTNET